MQRRSSSPATTINYLLGDLFETNNGGTITTNSYTDGPAGDLASFTGPPTGTATYLYYDAHGNLAAEADSTGALTASHTYDPFGAPTDTPPANTTVHRFVGRWDKQYDTSTGLMLMGARAFDPTTGRFLSNDPVPGGSLNFYDYAGQDPVNNYDLTGEALEAALDEGVGGSLSGTWNSGAAFVAAGAAIAAGVESAGSAVVSAATSIVHSISCLFGCTQAHRASLPEKVRACLALACSLGQLVSGTPGLGRAYQDLSEELDKLEQILEPRSEQEQEDQREREREEHNHP